jgi:hypothetical protein
VQTIASRDHFELLDVLIRHQPFEMVLPRLYSRKFASVSVLEEKFRSFFVTSKTTIRPRDSAYPKGPMRPQFSDSFYGKGML